MSSQNQEGCSPQETEPPGGFKIAPIAKKGMHFHPRQGKHSEKSKGQIVEPEELPKHEEDPTTPPQQLIRHGHGEPAERSDDFAA